MLVDVLRDTGARDRTLVHAEVEALRIRYLAKHFHRMSGK